MDFAIVRPASEHLASYVDALRKEWSPDNTRATAYLEQLESIEADADGFLKSLDDPEAQGAPITLPDGSTVPRLPGFRRWMWDGEFCGSIGFRWQNGTAELPPYTLGHIGYAVVPWKRNKGYATQALRLLLPEARKLGLSYVELTTDPENVISHKVILNNGGVLVERFTRAVGYGGGEELRWRIDLTG